MPTTLRGAARPGIEDSRQIRAAYDRGVNPRGILYPAQLPTFERRAPSPAADPLVRWFWISQWRIAPGRTSRQNVLPFPALNLAVESDLVGLAGASTGRSHRDLTGTGWVVGALLRPAATAALTDDAPSILDLYVELDEPGLHAETSAAMRRGDLGAACLAIESWLAARVPTVTDEAESANRLVARIEDDEAILTVEEAAAAIGVSVRTAQRLTRRYVGLTPLALIHRRRLQHAAQLLSTEPDTAVSRIAADLGYADQSHLVRDFRKVLGFTPGGYRRGEV
ncbi:helix-turn-helix transcriptional regulator [Tsukamurella spumae]|uniref:Helix-turn-helix transcriptional regulator n=1 Tax=Tsukamurella spumae TaxID=44753 RepID=A0A846X3X4_9ACTN|nr:helix-turn-helix transcriptional regulator [Tsukamurella spumae]